MPQILKGTFGPQPHREPPKLVYGPGGPHDGGMDELARRVGVLEGDIKEVKSDLKTLLRDSAEMKGRLSQLPTWWQMLTAVVAILAAAFAILKFGI